MLQLLIQAINIMSLGVDFEITQVVDANVGIHSVIPKYAAATIPVLLCLCIHLSVVKALCFMQSCASLAMNKLWVD